MREVSKDVFYNIGGSSEFVKLTNSFSNSFTYTISSCPDLVDFVEDQSLKGECLNGIIQ